jgi:hypothetical protein
VESLGGFERLTRSWSRHLRAENKSPRAPGDRRRGRGSHREARRSGRHRRCRCRQGRPDREFHDPTFLPSIPWRRPIVGSALSSSFSEPSRRGHNRQSMTRLRPPRVSEKPVPVLGATILGPCSRPLRPSRSRTVATRLSSETYLVLRNDQWLGAMRRTAPGNVSRFGSDRPVAGQSER